MVNAAAKSLQSCPSLCDPIDGSPPGSPIPGDSPGKNTGVGCHFLLQCMKMKSESEVVQLCPTLSNPRDCSPPGSSIHEIFQARVLEWGAIAFSMVNARESLKKKKKKQMARIRSSQGALKNQNLESKIHQKPFPLLRPIGRSYDLVSFQGIRQLYYLRFFSCTSDWNSYSLHLQLELKTISIYIAALWVTPEGSGKLSDLAVCDSNETKTITLHCKSYNLRFGL